MLTGKGLNDTCISLGKFDKIKEIGKGGQGNVFLIRESENGKLWAAKYLISSSEGKHSKAECILKREQ